MKSEAPRIGVFLCRCHGEGKCDVLDMDSLVEFLESQPDVVFVQQETNLCSDEAKAGFLKSIRENSLDRVMLGMCSPNKHLDEFRDLGEEAGLNRYLVDSVNIREQIAFIHGHMPEDAQVKLYDQFFIALAKLRVTNPAKKIYAIVDDLRCNGCEICYTVCDKGAISMVPDVHGRVSEVSSVDTEKCWGCGVCVTSCPVHAMDMTVYSNLVMQAQVDAFIQRMRPDAENVLVLNCHWCAYPAADAAGKKRLEVDPNFRSIRTPCSGRIDPDWILKAITRGVDGVLLLGGKPGTCHFESGNIRTMSRMKLIKMLLSQTGLHEGRFHVDWINPDEPERYASVVNDFIKDLRKLGPNPLASVDEDYSSAKSKKRG